MKAREIVHDITCKMEVYLTSKIRVVYHLCQTCSRCQLLNSEDGRWESVLRYLCLYVFSLLGYFLVWSLGYLKI
jgi:hypothetical protein